MNIVLSHGILGFSHIGAVDYFRDVAEQFEKQGHRVIAPQVDPTRGVEFRGNQLRDQIKDAFTARVLDSNQKTHIIAHSMGGLDSRFMLSPANPGRIQLSIRSLTTISTPHRGSPVADLVDSPAQSALFRTLLGNSLQDALDHLDISLNGLRDLTTARCQEFNKQFTDNPQVAYFSVAGSGRAGFLATSGPLLIFHKYILAKTGEPNDGMVTTASANWGRFDPGTWPGDHAEEIGYNLDKLLIPPAFYLEKYDQILANVAQL